MADTGFIVLLEHPGGTETVLPEGNAVFDSLNEAVRVATWRSQKTPARYAIYPAWMAGSSRVLSVRAVVTGV